jgi:hypothetical protein
VFLRRILTAAAFSILYLIAAFRHANYVPDLPVAEAASLIVRAPEFSRYARMIHVEHIDHSKGSMKTMSIGSFTFQYLDAAGTPPPIQASADFRYWDGAWHLNSFDYGCPADCHFAVVYKAPAREHPHPILDMLLFRYSN